MKRVAPLIGSAAIVAAGIVVCTLTSSYAANGPDAYCDAYARDAANRKTGIDETTPVGADHEKWRLAQEKAYESCMSHYEVRVKEKAKAVKVAVKPAAAKKSGKPKVGSQEWIDWCNRRFRSFDEETGNYKSYSGVWKPCR